MKQNDHIEYAYLVLHGVINLYDEEWDSEIDEYSSDTSKKGLLDKKFRIPTNTIDKYDDFPVNGSISLLSNLRT